MTAQTATASTVHEPIGKPGGPGLFHHKGLELPPYIQHVAHHMLANGMDESHAIGEAVGIVRNWAEGHDGHGRKVHADVQAAAAKNIAEWERDKAGRGSSRSITHAGRAAMATSTKAPYGSDVEYADPGYLDADGNQASKSGKPGVKRYPLSADHVMAAWTYISQDRNAGQYTPDQLSEIKGKIRSAMKQHGHDVSDQPASASRSELMRDYPLEDLHIVRSGDGGDGRTMEAFAAVFNQETAIRDQEGQYLEIIEPVAFNKRLSDLKRSRQGFGQVKVLFNHGRDMEGNPDGRFQMPVAVPVSIEATPRGLLTRSRFVSTPLGDEVLELVRSGAVTAMSFNGRIIRSDPQLGRYGRHRPDSSGRLTTVRRMELGLREFGPVLFPAYEGAEINGVRMSTPGTWEPDDEFDPGTPPDGAAAAGEPFTPEEGAEHSARYHQHALYALRSREEREKAGLVW